MTKNLNNILEILFKYYIDHANGCPSINIPSCLKELSLDLDKQNIYNLLQDYFLPNGAKHCNLLVFNSRLKGPFILFQGHIDTVPTNYQYQPIINRQKITGRGAVDMKGPLAGMIDAFIALYSQDLKYPPALLITGDEEANAFAGIKHFLKFRQIPIFFSLCGEPSNLEIQTSFKGVISYEIIKKGETGHSAYPGKRLLIEEMTPILNAVIKFLKEVQKIKDKNLGKTVGGITVINSGTKSNQLPESFRMNWNLRTVKPRKIYDKLLNRIVLREMPKGTKINSFSFDPVKINIPNELKKIIKKSFKDTNIKYKESTTVFFTEASLMNMQNIPTIVCGPGNPQLAHTDPAKETIKIKDIKKYSKLLQEIVKNINN